MKPKNLPTKVCSLLNSFSSAVKIDSFQEIFKNTNVKISKLAQGLPVGGEIEFLDDGTLISAFKNRGDVIND